MELEPHTGEGRDIGGTSQRSTIVQAQISPQEHFRINAIRRRGAAHNHVRYWPEYLPILWSHIPHRDIVSYTENSSQNDSATNLGLCIRDCRE